MDSPADANQLAALDLVGPSMPDGLPEDPLALLMRQIVGGYFMLTDGHGVVSKWGEPAELLFGLDAPDALGRPLFDHLVTGPYSSDAEAWRGFLEHGRAPFAPAKVELTGVSANAGEAFGLELVFIPVKLDEGFDFSLFLEDLGFELPANLMMARMRQQHPVVVRAFGEALGEEPQPWQERRTAGTLVAFRPTTPTPWVQEEMAARELARAEAEAELERQLTDPDPGVQGESIYELEDAAAVVARMLDAFRRIETLEGFTRSLPEEIDATRSEAETLRACAEAAEREARQARADVDEAVARLRDDATARAERQEFLERLEQLERSGSEAAEQLRLLRSRQGSEADLDQRLQALEAARQELRADLARVAQQYELLGERADRADRERAEHEAANAGRLDRLGEVRGELLARIEAAERASEAAAHGAVSREELDRLRDRLDTVCQLAEGGGADARSAGEHAAAVARDLEAAVSREREISERLAAAEHALADHDGAVHDLAGRTEGLANELTARTDGLANDLTTRIEGLSNDLAARNDGLARELAIRTDDFARELAARTDGLAHELQGLQQALSSIRELNHGGGELGPEAAHALEATRAELIALGARHHELEAIANTARDQAADARGVAHAVETRLTDIADSAAAAAARADEARGVAEGARAQADEARGVAEGARTHADEALGVAEGARAHADAAREVAEGARAQAVDGAHALLEIRESSARVHGEVDDVRRSVSQLHGNVDEVRESVSQLHGNVDEVRESVSHLHGNVDEVRESVAHVGGQTHEVRESVSHLQGRVDEVAESVSRVAGHAHEVGESVSHLHGRVGDVLEQHAQQAGATRDEFVRVRDAGEAVRADALRALQESERLSAVVAAGEGRLDQRLSGLEARVAELAGGTAALHEGLRATGERLERVGDHVGGLDDSLSSALAETRADVFNMRGEAEGLRSEAVALREAVADIAARSATAAGEEVGSLRADVDELRGLLGQYRQGFDEARQAAVLARREAEQARRAMESGRAAQANEGAGLQNIMQQLLGAAAAASGSAPSPAARAGESDAAATPAAGRRRLTPASARVAKPQPAAREPRPGFDDMSVPMAVLDLEGRFRQLNPAFAKLVGYQEHEFTNARWPSVHDRGALSEQEEQLKRLASGELERIDVRSTYLHGQGLMVLVSGSLVLARKEDGTPGHLLLTAEDR